MSELKSSLDTSLGVDDGIVSVAKAAATTTENRPLSFGDFLTILEETIK